MSNSIKSIALLLISLIFFWVTIRPAMNFGEIWELRTHPHKNVEVQLENTMKLTGTLSRSWNGDLTLQTIDSTYQFSREQIKFMSIPFDENEMKERARSFFHSWRTFIPAAVVFAIHANLLFYALLLSRREKIKLDSTKKISAST